MGLGQTLKRLSFPLHALAVIPIPMRRHERSQHLQAHGHGLRKQSSLHLIDALAFRKRLLQELAHPVELFPGLANVQFFL
jgi:hypothetical protein